MDTDLKIRMSPPLGLYTIVNMFQDKHKVTVENENIEDINYDDKPDLVGISVTVDVYPRAKEIARQFREKGIKVVAGGIHVTTAYHTIPDNVFDSLCIGSAEGTWPDIISDMENNTLKPLYRCQNKIEGDKIASPAYDAISHSEKYLFCNIIHTSRGCPFKCDFCYNSSPDRTYSVRPVDDVINEIKAAHSKHIMIIDDNFLVSPARMRDFLKAIKPLHLKWHCAISINITDHPELLDEMRESGCKSLFIGFESISPSSINSVHKVQNHTTAYDDAVKMIHDRGMMINASFVFGLDSDTPETFKLTLNWIVKNKIETVTSHILTPYPGTKLYERMDAERRITSRDLSLYNTAHVVFQPKGMTPEQLYNGYLWIYDNIYSFKNIIRRIPKSRDQIIPYLVFNLFYRKFGRFSDKICKLLSYNKLAKLMLKVSDF